MRDRWYVFIIDIAKQITLRQYIDTGSTIHSTISFDKKKEQKMDTDHTVIMTNKNEIFQIKNNRNTF